MLKEQFDLLLVAIASIIVALLVTGMTDILGGQDIHTDIQASHSTLSSVSLHSSSRTTQAGQAASTLLKKIEQIEIMESKSKKDKADKRYVDSIGIDSAVLDTMVSPGVDESGNIVAITSSPPGLYVKDSNYLAMTRSWIPLPGGNENSGEIRYMALHAWIDEQDKSTCTLSLRSDWHVYLYCWDSAKSGTVLTESAKMKWEYQFRSDSNSTDNASSQLPPCESHVSSIRRHAENSIREPKLKRIIVIAACHGITFALSEDSGDLLWQHHSLEYKEHRAATMKKLAQVNKLRDKLVPTDKGVLGWSEEERTELWQVTNKLPEHGWPLRPPRQQRMPRPENEVVAPNSKTVEVGEVPWVMYRTSLLRLLPFAWRGRRELRFEHFFREAAKKGSAGNASQSDRDEQTSEREIERVSNVIAVTSNHGLEVLDLHSGHAVTHVMLSEKSTFLDITMDGVIERVSVFVSDPCMVFISRCPTDFENCLRSKAVPVPCGSHRIAQQDWNQDQKDDGLDAEDLENDDISANGKGDPSLLDGRVSDVIVLAPFVFRFPKGGRIRKPGLSTISRHLHFGSTEGPLMPSVVRFDLMSLVISSTGVVSCLDVKTGKLKWSTKLAAFHSWDPHFDKDALLTFASLDEPGPFHALNMPQYPTIAVIRTPQSAAIIRLRDGFLLNEAIIDRHLFSYSHPIVADVRGDSVVDHMVLLGTDLSIYGVPFDTALRSAGMILNLQHDSVLIPLTIYKLKPAILGTCIVLCILCLLGVAILQIAVASTTSIYQKQGQAGGRTYENRRKYE